ncbi:MAG: hypothetical protein CMJ11_00830 [Pelagibacterales bacterium]|nr:hypothetical protein [Pelagibacterales bacterium]
MSDVFQEVDEELREEKYKSIWRKFRYYVIGGLILFILGIAANAFWKDYNLKEINDRSERFFTAIEMAQEDKVNAITLLEKFANQEERNSEYNALIARFTEAAIRRSEKDFNGALLIYQSLEDNNISNFYEDYAKLSSVEMLIALNNKKDAKLILDDLISNTSDLKYIAMEYLGYLEIDEGNFSKARTIFTNIADEASSSVNMKNRSREVLSILP